MGGTRVMNKEQVAMSATGNVHGTEDEGGKRKHPRLSMVRDVSDSGKLRKL